MLITVEAAHPFFRRFIGLGRGLAKPFKWLERDLGRIGFKEEPAYYVLTSGLNAFAWSFSFFLLMAFLLSTRPQGIEVAPLVLPPTLVFCFMFSLFIYYPRIILKKIAERIDRNLVYALKDLRLQVSSGVCLFDGMTNVSKTNYGEISQEFEKVVREINAGVNEIDALERLGVRTESRFVKKSIWQLVNVLRSGASVTSALRGVVDSLTSHQQKLIRDFTQELNLWSLIYMLFAVIAPTLGTTMLVVLSAFGGSGVSRELFLAVVLVSFIVQGVIIGFIKNRRPVIHG
jgi:flagellar protein FlaJ